MWVVSMYDGFFRGVTFCNSLLRHHRSYQHRDGCLTRDTSRENRRFRSVSVKPRVLDPSVLV